MLKLIEVPEIPERIVKEVQAAAAAIEAGSQVRCVVVYNPYRIGFGGGILTLSLILCPLKGEIDDNQFKERAICFFEADRREAFRTEKQWAWLHTIGMLDLRSWFERFRDHPEKFIFQSAAAGADLISPVLYGEELVANWRDQAEAFFGPQISDIWHAEIPRRLALCIATKERLIEYHRERRKILNRHELAEMKNFLLRMRELLVQRHPRHIIALDGSGRPLGRALQWFLGGSLNVTYLSPHSLRKLNLNSVVELKEAANALRKELPRLYDSLSSRPSDILFVDDQTGYGHTQEALGKFIKFLSGEDTVYLETMSTFAGTNTPTWLRRRDLQGIRLCTDRFSFLSIEALTEKSRRFYRDLQRCVMKWKKDDKQQGA